MRGLIFLLTFSFSLQALSPPVPSGELCEVRGKVLNVEADEVRPDFKVLKIKVTASAVHKGKYGLANCSEIIEGKTIWARFCDKGKTIPKPKESIKGIYGLSIGGGRHCIQKVTF